MTFIRNNMFLVILAGVTVILVAAMLVYASSVSSALEEEDMADRKALERDLDSLYRQTPYANIETNRARQKLVDRVKNTYNEVLNQSLEFNSGDLAVPQLPMGNGETMPALPYDEDVWEENRLYYSYFYSQAYHNRMEALLAELQATTLPSDEEVAREATRRQKEINLRERIREKEEGEMETTTPSEGPAGVEGPGPMIMGGGTRRSRRTAVNVDGEEIRVGQEAQQIARQHLRYTQSRAGRIYADKQSLDLLLEEDQDSFDPPQLWKAQLSLWVYHDVLRAIDATIVEVAEREGLDPATLTVPRSAVRRLVEVRMSAATERREERQERPGPDPSVQSGPMIMPGMGGSRSRPSRRDTGPSELPGAESLTQNTTNEFMDVVQYSFTVIMPSRYLPDLYENLAQQNYHVVLSEEISTEPYNPESMYYYGAEPVSRVVVTAELQLLSDFTRGRWDEKEKTWVQNRYPLMPRDVMETLPEEALRSQDLQFIEGELPMPWSSTWLRAKEQEKEIPDRGAR